MYRRMYGLPRNHGTPMPIKKGSKIKQERRLHAAVHTSEKLVYEPVIYCARPRKRERPSQRDAALWKRALDASARARLFDIEKEREEEKEEKRREREKERAEREKEADEKEKEEMEREREREKARERSRLAAAELEALKGECLVVEDVELHIQANSEKHHTDLFECTDRDKDPQLVVRRGQEFEMTLTFQRPWSSADDDMWLVLKIGDEPNERKGTYRKMKLKERKGTNYMTGPKKKWGTRIIKQEGNTLTIGIYTPPNIIIGEWEYSIRTIKGKDGKEEIYDCEGDEEVIVLLNPWCEDDQVYMKDTDDLKEYINNETGLVFCGSHKNIQSKPWDYGHFKEGILESVLHILRKANDFDISANMGDPVYISRFLSRILNNLDDNGVLVGRWDGDYSDGERPTSWLGSAPIIETYMEDEECKPVKYGQCWVFSHLLTTFCRALGLPCRSVTNFSSAHDTDLTMTIDKYVDENGDEMGWKNSDSVWNFHVWNEVWIMRSDLDKLTGMKNRYDGWQAVDATPQELSDSVYQCGPAPVVAIKEGDVHIGYDTKFIFAEVNAEYCNWRDGDPPQLVNKNSYRVGRKISTKYPNGSSVGYYRGHDNGVRLDLTDQYKYAEGSAHERAVVEKATQRGDMGDHLFENTSGIEITIDEPDARVRIGQDVKIKVTVKNTSDKKLTLRMRTSVRPMNYWGALLGKKKIANKLHDETLLNAGHSETYEVTAEGDDILSLCDDSLSMKILAFCTVDGSAQPVFESEELSIKAPGIKCTGPSGSVASEEVFSVEMVLKNPLPRQSLTKCQLKIEGGVTVEDDDFTKKKSAFVKDIDDLKPGEVRTISVKVKANPKPRRSKERELNVGLLSKELPDFVGNLHIDLR